MSKYILKASIIEPSKSSVNVIKCKDIINVEEEYTDIDSILLRYYTLKSMYQVKYIDIFRVELRKIDCIMLENPV